MCIYIYSYIIHLICQLDGIETWPATYMPNPQEMLYCWKLPVFCIGKNGKPMWHLTVQSLSEHSGNAPTRSPTLHAEFRILRWVSCRMECCLQQRFKCRAFFWCDVLQSGKQKQETCMDMFLIGIVEKLSCTGSTYSSTMVKLAIWVLLWGYGRLRLNSGGTSHYSASYGKQWSPWVMTDLRFSWVKSWFSSIFVSLKQQRKRHTFASQVFWHDFLLPKSLTLNANNLLQGGMTILRVAVGKRNTICLAVLEMRWFRFSAFLPMGQFWASGAYATTGVDKDLGHVFGGNPSIAYFDLL